MNNTVEKSANARARGVIAAELRMEPTTESSQGARSDTPPFPSGRPNAEGVQEGGSGGLLPQCARPIFDPGPPKPPAPYTIQAPNRGPARTSTVTRRNRAITTKALNRATRCRAVEPFSGAAARAHEETRIATADDAWKAAIVACDLDHAALNREAARRLGAPERALPPAWAALALEGLAMRALGPGAVIVALDLKHRVAMRVGEEVRLRFEPLLGHDVSAKVEAKGARGGLVEGTLRARYEEA